MHGFKINSTLCRSVKCTLPFHNHGAQLNQIIHRDNNSSSHTLYSKYSRQLCNFTIHVVDSSTIHYPISFLPITILQINYKSFYTRVKITQQ